MSVLRSPPSCSTGGGLPPAVWHPQEKHVLDFVSMTFADFVVFLSILLKIGRPLPRNVSNSRNCVQKIAFSYLPAEPPEPAEVVSASAAQTPLTHAPGVRMTGVRQTPSNDKA